MGGPPGAGRLLAVDWGEKRIGLALSDESQAIAQPLDTLVRRAGKRFPMQRLLAHLDAHGIVGVVVGLPLNEAGGDGPYATAVRVLAADIARRSVRPVVLWDERLSTARALQAVHQMGGTTRGRKADLDALAATVLLQHFLDARRGGAT